MGDKKQKLSSLLCCKLAENINVDDFYSMKKVYNFTLKMPLFVVKDFPTESIFVEISSSFRVFLRS